jgi:hypothetical protein
MKFSAVVALLSLGSASAFVAPSRTSTSSNTELSAVDRRQFAQVAFTIGAATFLGGAPALAAPRGSDYVAKYADLKLISGLVSGAGSIIYIKVLEACLSHSSITNRVVLSTT